MSVRETLDKLENLVVGAQHLPFSDKTIINDNDLIHYVEELRRDLPNELDRAEKIVNERDVIIDTAEKEAKEIRKKAEDYARQITAQQEIVKRAEEQARALIEQAQAHARALLEETQTNARNLQANADAYANQVFDQLINHVSGTFNGVRQAETGMQQALNVLTQAKQQMNNQAHAHEAEQQQQQSQQPPRHPSQMPQ